MYNIKTKIKYTLQIEVKTTHLNGSKPRPLSTFPNPNFFQLRQSSN